MKKLKIIISDIREVNSSLKSILNYAKSIESYNTKFKAKNPKFMLSVDLRQIDLLAKEIIGLCEDFNTTE